MKQILVLLVAFLGLASCVSNSPIELHYYLLDSSESHLLDSKSTKTNAPLVLIGSIKMSEYLQQSSLSIETTEHQIHHAHNHLWAEPLSDAVTKSLLKDLRAASGSYQYEAMTNRWQGKAHYQIAVVIDRFHPISQQQVVLSGRFWMSDSAKNEIKAQDFHFSKQLTKDGFAHSVKIQRQLVTDLANTLLVSLPKSK